MTVGFLTAETLCDSGDCLVASSVKCPGCGSRFCAPHAGFDGYCPSCGETWQAEVVS